MKKQHRMILTALLSGSLLIAACSPSSKTATPDANLVITQAAMTVAAQFDSIRGAHAQANQPTFANRYVCRASCNPHHPANPPSNRCPRGHEYHRAGCPIRRE